MTNNNNNNDKNDNRSYSSDYIQNSYLALNYELTAFIRENVQQHQYPEQIIYVALLEAARKVEEQLLHDGMPKEGIEDLKNIVEQRIESIRRDIDNERLWQ
jgi:hypothetical protein